MKINNQEMVLYAWVGEDEFGSGKVGLKQVLGRAGVAPLVVVDFDLHKIYNERMVAAMAEMSRVFGKKIRLCKFEMTEIIREAYPDGSSSRK